MDSDVLLDLALHVPPDLLPILLCAGIWMWNMAEDQAPANHCVDGCVTLRTALGEFGIFARLEPVLVTIYGPDSASVYGSETPHWRADGTFNGHVVLFLPAARRFVDATLQQFEEVPRSMRNDVPLIGLLPEGAEFSSHSMAVVRDDHQVVYEPIRGDHSALWSHPTISENQAAYLEAGQNLAANVFDMLRIPDLLPRTRRAPYPRLQLLLDRLQRAESLVSDGAYLFRDDGTGALLRLDDVR